MEQLKLKHMAIKGSEGSVPVSQLLEEEESRCDDTGHRGSLNFL